MHLPARENKVDNLYGQTIQTNAFLEVIVLVVQEERPSQRENE
jgi:hypothetical protein